MPLTYAQIREEQERLKLDHLSSAEFSRLRNKMTGSREYDAGLGSGLGKGIKGASYALDQFLAPTAEFTGDLGQLAFGDKGRKAFEGLPRETLEMLPFMRATKLAAAGGAGMMAANTYEKTNSSGAALISGGFGLALPAFGRMGQSIAGGRGVEQLKRQGEKVLVADGLKRTVVQGAAAKEALRISNEAVARGGAASALNLGLGLSTGQKVGQVAGQQLGMFAGNVASSVAQGAYLGGAEGAIEAMSPENLAVAALSQVPGAMITSPKAIWGTPEQAAVAAYAKTVKEFGPDANTQRPNQPIHDFILQEYQAKTKDAGKIIQNDSTITGSTQATQVLVSDPTKPFVPVSRVIKGPDGDYTTFNAPEKVGEVELPVGSMNWLRAKGGLQNVAFRTRESAEDYILKNKAELSTYTISNIKGQSYVLAKLRAKEVPETGANKVTEEKPATFYDQPSKVVDPQLELALEPAIATLPKAETVISAPTRRITKKDLDTLPKVPGQSEWDALTGKAKGNAERVLDANGIVEGDQVEFFAEKKRTGVVNNKGMIVDASGNPWGVTGILASNNGYVLKLNSKNEPAGVPSVVSPKTETKPGFVSSAFMLPDGSTMKATKEELGKIGQRFEVETKDLGKLPRTNPMDEVSGIPVAASIQLADGRVLQAPTHALAYAHGLELGIDRNALEQANTGFINESGQYISRDAVKIANPGKGIAEDFEFGQPIKNEKIQTQSEQTPVPQVPETPIQKLQALPTEAKIELIESPDPSISLPAKVLFAEVEPTFTKSEVEARSDLPIVENLAEVQEVLGIKAKEKIAGRGVAQANRERGLLRSEAVKVWWELTEKSLTPEERGVYESFAGKGTEKIQAPEYQSNLLSAFNRWWNGTTKVAKAQGGVPKLNGVEGLRSVLAGVKRSGVQPQREGRRAVKGIDSEGNPVFEGKRRLSFETKEAAQRVADGFAAKLPGTNWSTPFNNGKYQIQQDILAKPALESKPEQEFDIELLSDIPEVKPVFTERDLATSDLAREVNEGRKAVSNLTVKDYVQQLHDSEEGLADLESLGFRDTEGESLTEVGGELMTQQELGAARLEYALLTFGDGTNRQQFFNKLVKNSDLFADANEAVTFMSEAAVHLGKWSREKIKLMADRTLGNNEPVTLSLEGEKLLSHELLKRVGLAEPEYLDVASRLITLHDNQNTLFAQLQNPAEVSAGGAFSVSRKGERMVWLATIGSKEQTMFTLAHELNGHGLWDLYQQGKLDPQTSNRMKVFSEFVKQNTELSPETNNIILKELFAQLPKRYKMDKGLRALMEFRELDVEENIANIHALISLNLVATPKSGLRSLMTYLPKSVADMFDVAGKWGRKFMQTVAGVLLNREKVQGLSIEARGQLEAYTKTMKSLMKINEQNALAVRDALKLQNASEIGRFGKTISTLEGLDSLEPRDQVGQEVWKAMGLDKLKEQIAKPFKKTSTFWDRQLQLGILLGQKFPEMRYTTSRAVEREAAYNKIEFDMLSTYNMVKKGFNWKFDKNSAVTKVAETMHLADARDKIILAVNKGKYNTFMDAIAAKDGEVIAELAALTPAEQILVKENLVKFEHVQAKFSEVIRDQRYAKITHIVTNQLMGHDSSLAFKQAQQMSEQAVADIRSGVFKTTGYSDVDALLTFTNKTVEEFHAKASTNLGFVTETRYGDFKAFVEFADGRPRAMITAHSQNEFNTLREQYESGAYGPFKAFVDKTKMSKTEFRMNDQVEFLLSKDAEHANELAAALMREGLPIDKVRQIVDQYSFAKELRNEMAQRELADSSGKIAKFEKRRHATGREHLDMLQQQITFIQHTARALTKGTFKADFDASLNSPEMRAHPEKQLAQQMWDNYSRQDPNLVKMINKVQYNMFMTFHFLNMLQDGAQPILGALPANLVNEGQTIAGAYGNVSKSMMNILTKKGLTPDEKVLLENRQKENSGLGMYSDETSNDALALVQARRVQKGLDVQGVGSVLKKAIMTPLGWGRNLHKHFTDYSSSVALLTAFRHYRAKGLGVKEATDNAKQLMSISMFNAGKAGRSIGIRAGEGVFGQSVAATMTGLQTYSLGTIGTLKNFIDRSFKNVPGMTKGEITQARKALGVSLLSTVAQAGVYGLPGVAALTVLLEKVFNFPARQAIAETFQGETEPGEDDVIQQVALHGLLNTITGYDVASKSSVTSLLGFNSYDGFNMEQLSGPTGQLIGNMFTAVKEGAQGNWVNSGKEFLPNQIKRAVTQWQNDGEFRTKEQKLIDYSTGKDQLMFGLLGLKPTEIARKQELLNMQYTASEIDVAKNKEWVKDQAATLLNGDQAAVQHAIAERVEQNPDLSAEALGEFIIAQMIDMTTPQDPRRMQGASEELASSLNVPYNGPSEIERIKMRNEAMQSLQLPTFQSPAQLRQASQIERMQATRPNMSRPEILEALRQSKVNMPQLRSRAWVDRVQQSSGF